MLNLYRDIEIAMSRIERKWQKLDYSTDHFAEVTWEETKSLDLSALGEVSNQLKLLELPGIRFQQQRSTFSDLYIQIFHNGRFMIEILNWWGGHVNVHDHDFAAVQFQLKGDALNVEYDFEASEQTGALRFGELKVRQSEIWKEGGRSLVHPGSADPHSVFHIGEPTTSLLIRTISTPRYGSQSNYFPDLAAHYYVSNDIQRKKLTALNLLSGSYPEEFRSHLDRYLNSQSASENFFMLTKLASILLREQYSDILNNYASRGERETKIVNSVVINHGIEFLKARANDTPGITYNEKLAIFSVAASHSEDNFKKVVSGVKSFVKPEEIDKGLRLFLDRINEDDRNIVEGYFGLFGIRESLHEKK